MKDEGNFIQRYSSWRGFCMVRSIWKIKTIDFHFISLSPSFNPFSIINMDQKIIDPLIKEKEKKNEKRTNKYFV